MVPRPRFGPGDYPSFLLYVLDQTHVTVTAATALVVLLTRDAHAVWFSAGAVGATLVAKHTIRQPRPPPPPPESKPAPVRPKRTFGMPSTHSTALAFYLVYLWPLLPLTSAPLPLERCALLAISLLGLWSRVELGYHTVAQVLGGSAVGLVCALAWGQVWDAYPGVGAEIQSVVDAVWAWVTAFF